MRGLSWLVAILSAWAISSVVHAAEIPGNLAPNASFELPENGADQQPVGWNVFSSKDRKTTLTDKVAASGRQCLKMTAQGLVNAFQGITFAIPVSEGEKYTFEAKCIADKEDRPGGTMDVRLVIEWKRDDNSEVSRTTSNPVKATQISRLRWETMSLKKIPVPKDAVKAVFGIHLCDNDRGGSGTVYVDDVVILKGY